MPLTVRSLTDEEVTRMFPQRGQMDLSEYESIFDGAVPGMGYEVSNDGMSTRALKRRLGQAVKQALGPGYALRYRKTAPEDTALAFVVKSPSANGHADEAEPEPVIEAMPAPSPAPRRGRRRRVAV